MFLPPNEEIDRLLLSVNGRLFGTLLARNGVNPRTAMELMRHSDTRLTTNIYQHLELANTAGAVNMSPVIGPGTAARKTGTYATGT